MQDHLQQTMVISRRSSQETHIEKAASKTKGNAAYEAIEAATHTRLWQAKASRRYKQKCPEAETAYSGAIKDTLEKTEALEKHVQTVTMRAESLATTEADFSKTLLDRQEETQRNLNELLCPTMPDSLHTVKNRAAKKGKHTCPLEHT